jgi:hypothetical protein
MVHREKPRTGRWAITEYKLQNRTRAGGVSILFDELLVTGLTHVELSRIAPIDELHEYFCVDAMRLGSDAKFRRQCALEHMFYYITSQAYRM